MTEKVLQAVFTWSENGHALAVSLATDGDMIVALDGDLVAHTRPPDALASFRAIVGLVTREGLAGLEPERTAPLGGGFG